MKKLNNNIAWSLLSQFSNYGLSLIFTIFLARMVLPYDYGIINQAQTITAFFIIFADGGIVWSIVREKYIKNEEVINLFWINMAVGMLLTIICYLSAHTVSIFYNTEEVENVLKVLSLTFIFAGIYTPFQMWMKRELAFKKITLIHIISTAISGILAILTAFYGYGYWSLIILGISRSLMQLILFIILAKMPIGWYKFKTPIKQMIKFGIGLIGFGTVNYFARNLDNILIGKIDASELAFYAKAYFLMFLPSMLVTGALSGLMIAILAKVQDNPDKFQEIYGKVLRMIFVITFPITGYFLLFPRDPIVFFYGNNWEGSIVLLQALSIAAITQPLYNTIGWIYTAIGKSKEMFHWGVISSTILSLSFFAGVQWGAIGVAMTYSIVMGILFVYFGLDKAHKLAKIQLKESFKPLLPIAIIGILSLLIVKGIFSTISIENIYIEILLKVTILLCLYISFLYIKYKNHLIDIIMIQRGIK